MNKLLNSDGDIIISVGSDSSHIRNKEEYDKTIKRLICRIRTVWSRGGLDRHCNYSDLEEIMECDDIPKDKWSSLTNTAYYYFNKD